MARRPKRRFGAKNKIYKSICNGNKQGCYYRRYVVFMRLEYFDTSSVLEHRWLYELSSGSDHMLVDVGY